mgnify:FL=1
MMKLILEVLCCLVALSAVGMFLAIIYTDFKREQREAKLDKLREEWEKEEHLRQMEFYKKQ